MLIHFLNKEMTYLIENLLYYVINDSITKFYYEIIYKNKNYIKFKLFF